MKIDDDFDIDITNASSGTDCTGLIQIPRKTVMNMKITTILSIMKQPHLVKLWTLMNI